MDGQAAGEESGAAGAADAEKKKLVRASIRRRGNRQWGPGPVFHWPSLLPSRASVLPPLNALHVHDFSSKR